MAFSQGIGWGIGKHARRAIEKAFVFTVDTTLGDGLDNYTLNFTGAGYDIKTSDGQTITGATAATTINFPGPGTYDIKILGDVSTRTFANDLKLVDIKNWGVLDTPLAYAFGGANSLTTITAADQPVNLSLSALFRGAQNFAGGISHWDVSGVTGFSEAFSGTSFNEDISSWDTSSANSFNKMFNYTPFNNGGQPGIGNWDVSNVTNFNGCFGTTPFNQPIGSWTIKTSGPVNMGSMFAGATSFNQDLNAWDVSSVTIMTRMFNYASSFNGDVSNWDVSGVADLGYMFERASSFNHPGIGSWNTSGATSMASMFDGINGGMAFNQDISGWDVSNVLAMNNMFRGCYSLNQPFNSWNTSSLTSIPQVFFNCYSFNQPLNLWNTSNVTQMQNVFYNAYAFNQDISSWDITKVTIFNSFFTTTAFSTDNYDAVLVSWEDQLQVAYPAGAGYTPTIAIKFGATKYTLGGEAEAARTSLINTYGWTITDGGGIAVPFTFTVDTALGDGLAQFIIPTTGTGYNYNVVTSDGQSITGNTGNTTITFPSTGVYTIEIKGDFPSIFFDNVGDKLKITDIVKWGGIAWTNFNRAFYNCSNMTITAPDIPNVSAVGSFYFGFRGTAISGAIDLSSWDLSSVGQIGYMFADCTGITSVNLNSLSTNAITSDGVFLNSSNVTIITLPVGFRPTVTRNMFRHMTNLVEVVNIESWNTTSLSLTTYMFAGTPFNQDISGWDVSNMTTMQEIFYGAFAFNQDISSWDVSNVINMNSTFLGAVAFNQPLNTWNTSSVNDMANMFQGATSFNQPLNTWNTITVTNMTWMFGGATSFNQDLSTWNTSNVTSLSNTFESTTASSFGIANWDTSSVNNFNATFRFNTSFNEDISGWNVTGCTSNFNDTFSGCQSFNQPIGNWNITSSVTRLSNLLSNAVSFDQDLSSWNISSVTVFNNFASNVTLSTANYGALLVAWESQAPVYSGSINFGVSQYFLGSAVETARTSLINTYGWTITDGGGIADPAFIFEVNTRPNAGYPVSTEYVVSTWPAFNTYNYNIETSDGQIFTNRAGDTVITFPAVGIYQIKITGTFPSFRSANLNYSPDKLTRILNWGSIQWESFNQSFEGCRFITDIPATDTPNLSLVTDMYQAFMGCQRLASAVNMPSWDVSGVTNFESTLESCFRLNEPIGSWNTSSATTMTRMFYQCSDFDQNIGDWNISNVTDFSNFMFAKTAANYSAANLDDIYSKWSLLTVSPNEPITFGTIQYTIAGGQAGRNILTGAPNNWTITDGGGI